MTQFLGLTQTSQQIQFSGNNQLTTTYPVYVDNNSQTSWQGLVPQGAVEFSDLNPLGFNRSLGFNSGMTIFGRQTLLSRAGQQLKPQDNILLNAAKKTGIPLYQETIANKNSFVSVADLPPYATPPTPIRVLLIPPIYSPIEDLNFSELQNSGYFMIVG